MNSLEEAAQLVDKVQGKIERLVDFGFRMLPKQNTQSTGLVLTHDKLGVIVKRPYLTDEHAEKPNFAIETIELDFPVDLEYLEDNACYCDQCQVDNFRKIFIQPIAEVDEKSQKKAYKFLANKIKDKYDIATRNCGIYNGAPVIFDW